MNGLLPFAVMLANGCFKQASKQASKTTHQDHQPRPTASCRLVRRMSTDVENQAKGVEKMGGRKQKTTL
jgi:hypothetical protein